MGSFRPVYDDDAVTLIRDTTSQWALTAGNTVTATNYAFISGAKTWTIALSNSVSAAAITPVMLVQINNCNPITRITKDGAVHIPWTVNPLLNQPSMGVKNQPSINPSFTGEWVNVGTIGGGVSLSAFTIPARFVRLLGHSVTALTTSSPAFVWTDSMSQGN